jgi:hypothetical protein
LLQHEAKAAQLPLRPENVQVTDGLEETTVRMGE